MHNPSYMTCVLHSPLYCTDKVNPPPRTVTKPCLAAETTIFLGCVWFKNTVCVAQNGCKILSDSNLILFLPV